MTTFKEIWDTLSPINVNAHTKEKMGLTYLSWTYAWSTLMDHYPSAKYHMGEPVTYPDGSMEVSCAVNIEDHTREMWLPVMDNKMNGKKNPNSRDINDARMRCLVKCLAMFGLGHYIYAGEDLPEASKDKDARELYATLQNDLRTAAHDGLDVLRAWMNNDDIQGDIEGLPKDWREKIRVELNGYLKELKELESA